MYFEFEPSCESKDCKNAVKDILIILEEYASLKAVHSNLKPLSSAISIAFQLFDEQTNFSCT
jgi:hypothetical protein